MTFDVIPAIDLRGGRVVRLVEGDFERETSYDDDPAGVAEAFAAAGARWIHVVDLDGARGEARQVGVVESILARLDGRAAVEVGGGLRSAEAVAAMLAAGASRVVLGTGLLRDPDLAAALVRDHGPGRVVAALDVRDGLAVGDGWRQGAVGRPVLEAIDVLADRGVEWFVVTAIARDGAFGGPDLDLLAGLTGLGRGRIVASGGIASIEDLAAARDAGCAGAIVGRAIYEGRIDLATALSEFTEPSA